MRDEYDFSNSVKNPYSKYLKQDVTLTLETEVIDYFQKLAQETGISYLNLMNLYLQDCVNSHRKPLIQWFSAENKG